MNFPSRELDHLSADQRALFMNKPAVAQDGVLTFRAPISASEVEIVVPEDTTYVVTWTPFESGNAIGAPILCNNVIALSDRVTLHGTVEAPGDFVDACGDVTSVDSHGWFAADVDATKPCRVVAGHRVERDVVWGEPILVPAPIHEGDSVTVPPPK
jgi:hypothetical protein